MPLCLPRLERPPSAGQRLKRSWPFYNFPAVASTTKKKQQPVSKQSVNFVKKKYMWDAGCAKQTHMKKIASTLVCTKHIQPVNTCCQAFLANKKYTDTYICTCMQLCTFNAKVCMYFIVSSWKQETKQSCDNNSGVNISLRLIDAKNTCSYIEKLMSDNVEFGT